MKFKFWELPFFQVGKNFQKKIYVDSTCTYVSIRRLIIIENISNINFHSPFINEGITDRSKMVI